MRITVVGDALLDADVHGSARRLLQDNPVPIVDVDHVDHRPGGAGLAATLLAAAGHDVCLVTVLGSDDSAELIAAALPPGAVIAARTDRPTPVKRRVLADGHLVTRLDEHCRITPATVTEEMLEGIRTADALLVSDYGRGLTEDASIRAALDRAGARVPLVWDPHPAGAAPVVSACAVTPNFAEATTVSGTTSTDAPTVPAAHAAAEALLAEWDVGALVVTLGSRGALSLEARGGARFSPAHAALTGDACGAGDCFAGCLTAGLAGGAHLVDAVDRAIAETGEFLSRGGVRSLTLTSASGDATGGPADPQDSRASDAAAPDSERPPSLPSSGVHPAVRRARRVRSRGGTVVATGGCFDLLHAGHVRALSAARRMGDTLIVLLNSDASVRRLKGETRPIVQARDRAELLLALDCVDDVCIFDEDTPVDMLEQIRPEIWVKSDDYRNTELTEAEVIAAWGGRMVTVPFVPMRSTSSLAEALSSLDSTPS